MWRIYLESGLQFEEIQMNLGLAEDEVAARTFVAAWTEGTRPDRDDLNVRAEWVPLVTDESPQNKGDLVLAHLSDDGTSWVLSK